MKKTSMKKELKKQLEEDSYKKYCRGRFYNICQYRYPDKEEFKSWLYKLYQKKYGTISNNYLDNEDIEEKKEQLYREKQNLINNYKYEKNKIEKIVKQKNKFYENSFGVPDEKINEFIDNAENQSNYPYDLIDTQDEITFIGYLITNSEIRQNYIEDINIYFFAIPKMSNIYSLLKKYNGSESNLSEYLIQEGVTADEIECILKIMEDSNMDIDSIYLLLLKYDILRDYNRNAINPATRDFICEVPYLYGFSNYSIEELDTYLETAIETIEKEYSNDYKLKKDYKIITPIDLDLPHLFNEDTKIENFGTEIPFPIINKCIYGLRLGTFLGIGMLSNAGKTRFMTNLIAHLVLVEDKKVHIILNETTEDDFSMCIITSFLNNRDIQEKYDFSFNIPERDIRNIKNLKGENRQEFPKLIKMLEEKINKNLCVQITDNYTDTDLKNMIIQGHFSFGTEYVFYDTLKASAESMNVTDDLKKTATLLSEIAKKHQIFIACSFQLTDDTIKTAPELINRLNIANSKQIYHVMDTVILFKEIDKKDYSKYAFVKYKETQPQSLEHAKRYYACVLNKNRVGEKLTLIFEVDLDLNVWKELGKLLKK